MKLYIFTGQSKNINTQDIYDCLHGIAATTDTTELVTALYLLPGADKTRGTAYIHKALDPGTFTTGRGKWAFTKKFSLPDDLPHTFKLIRLRIDSNSKPYPHIENDIYGWEFHYPTFMDHLATLFAHELHHFRRYHLHLHPGEGEQSANKWAVQHVQSLGYRVKAEKRKKPKGKKLGYSTLIKKFPRLDPYAEFRDLKTDDQIRIRHDPARKYLNQTATVKRPIRSNSKRIVITTRDGKSWRWPLEWVERVTSGD